MDISHDFWFPCAQILKSSPDVLRIEFARWKSPVSEVLVDSVPGSANCLSVDFGWTEPVSHVVLRLLCGGSMVALQQLRDCSVVACARAALWSICGCAVVAL